MTSPAGCVVTTNSITIYNTLTPTISISASQNSICSGNSITFTASTTAGGTAPTFEWFKNGVSTGVTDSTYTSNNWSNNDTVYCVLNSNYACATVNQLNSNKVGVTVNTTPIATIAAIGNTTFCQGDSLDLHASAGSSNYRWMLNGSVISTSTDSVFYAKTSGDYSVEVSNGNCPDTSGSIIISVIQGPSVSVNPNTAQTICQGDTVKLTATTNLGNTIQWYNASGSINGAISSIYLAKTSGTYYARVSNGTCSANSNSVNVTVNPLPSAQISVSGATTFCQGDSVALSVSTGNGYSYQWFDGANVLTNATSDKLVAKTSGSYAVKVTAATCVSSSAGTIVTVNPLPAVPTINRASQVLTSSAATGYQWYNNGTAISGATNQTYTFNAGGKYMVEITDAKGCKNRSLEYNNTGINEAINTIGMTLQPNPTQGKFMINLSGVEKAATVVIYDLTGREITRKVMNQTTEIEMTNEPAGMYIVYVYAVDKVAYAKLEKL
ncbi:MAG: T9SS type A sorting domain-containing protein [Bacteroidetes bacterium]|nr:T9SS type A sorting domain-containing protein [Bacteroidota bacterium]